MRFFFGKVHLVIRKKIIRIAQPVHIFLWLKIVVLININLFCLKNWTLEVRPEQEYVVLNGHGHKGLLKNYMNKIWVGNLADKLMIFLIMLKNSFCLNRPFNSHSFRDHNDARDKRVILQTNDKEVANPEHLEKNLEPMIAEAWKFLLSKIPTG